MQYPTRGDNVKYDKVIRKCLDLCDINIMLYISTHTKLTLLILFNIWLRTFI